MSGLINHQNSSQEVEVSVKPPATKLSAVASELDILRNIQDRVLWLSTYMIHYANSIRENSDGVKVGGHQASSASLVSLMTALYFRVLAAGDRVSVKPHASPIFHAIQFLLESFPQRN